MSVGALVSESTRGAGETVDRDLRREAKFTKESLEAVITKRLKFIDEWLTPERFASKLDEAKFNQIAVYEGVLIDKLLALKGVQTQGFGVQEQRKLDEVLPALMNEMKRRGLSATLTERKAVINVPAE